MLGSFLLTSRFYLAFHIVWPRWGRRSFCDSPLERIVAVEGETIQVLVFNHRAEVVGIVTQASLISKAKGGFKLRGCHFEEVLFSVYRIFWFLWNIPELRFAVLFEFVIGGVLDVEYGLSKLD
jgi:hypothetical protein